MRNHAAACIHAQLELVNLAVDILHECHDEVEQLVLHHRLAVRVRDEERDVVSFYGLAAHHLKRLCAKREEVQELLRENFLEFVALLHLDADSQRVDGTFDEALFVFVAADDHGV